MDGIEDKIESGEMKKCGDITTLLSIGKKEFFLNCGFCNYTFCQLDNFIQHISEEHMYQFTVPKLEEVELAIDVGEELEDDEELMQPEYATEDADENNGNLRTFERVEIEFDETAVSDAVDAKESYLDDSMSDWNEETLNKSEPDSDSDFELGEENDKKKTEECNEDADYVANVKMLGLESSFDKNILLAIFKSYEQRPELWDAESHVPRYTKSRESQMRDIANEVGLGKDFRTVQKIIGKLSSRLRTEMIRKKIYTSKGKTYLPQWYTDINSFIKQRRPTVSKNGKPAVRKITTPGSRLTGEQFVILAQTYKQFPALWDVTDLTHYFSNRRREAQQNIFETFNEKCNLKLTKTDLEYEISRLRKICSCEKRRKILCKRQNKTFKPTFKYYEHINYIEDDVTPYECLKCGKIIGGPQQYKTHVASHDGLLPFKCIVCEHRFKFFNNFVTHLRRHAQDFIYSCEVCKKQLATTTELKIHMRVHTGERPFICEFCGNKYRSSSDLKVHMSGHDDVKRFTCEICSKSFKKKSRLSEHMYVHTKIRNKICNFCNKGFTSAKHLRQHKQIHAAEKKYCCKICGKRFAQYAGLSGHVKSHGTTLTEINSKTVEYTPIDDSDDDDEYE
ncbi:myoneurin-like isoform X2 [Eurosta solidaginis]|uniref:myoneurin-like isoform X2 n=1 Tax=Eurosta solidaginis TaxID=178769 RepID=UPI0035315625